MTWSQFWQQQADELHHRAQTKQILADIPAPDCISNGPNKAPKLDPAAAATEATDRITRKHSPAMLCDNHNSDLMRKIRWLDMLRQAHAQGAERVMIADFRSLAHAEFDVELALVAAQLDVLDALAPLIRNKPLIDDTKEVLHRRALQTMADKDTSP